MDIIENGIRYVFKPFYFFCSDISLGCCKNGPDLGEEPGHPGGTRSLSVRTPSGAAAAAGAGEWGLGKSGVSTATAALAVTLQIKQ